MHTRRFCASPSSHLLAFVVAAGVTMFTAPLSAEPTSFSQETFLRAKQATVGILQDTQDQRTPERPGKIVVRGTGVHLGDGYIITARHAAEKHDLSTGAIIQKHVRILTADLHELPADLVGDSSFMDVVIYRVVRTTSIQTAGRNSRSPLEMSSLGWKSSPSAIRSAGAPPWPSAVLEIRIPSSKPSRHA